MHKSAETTHTASISRFWRILHCLNLFRILADPFVGDCVPHETDA